MTSSTAPAIIWFREDFRLSDNPALHTAHQEGRPVVCLYIHETAAPGVRSRGGASLWRLHGALSALASALAIHHIPLLILRGDACAALRAVSQTTQAEALYWTRRYESAKMESDQRVKTELGAQLNVKSFNGKLLVEPWIPKTASGKPFQIFSPYWRWVISRLSAAPLPPPSSLTPAPIDGAWLGRLGFSPLSLEDLALAPRHPNWATHFIQDAGEAAAQTKLADFIDGPLMRYAELRDRFDWSATSNLSAHLALGEISPTQIVAAIRHSVDADAELARGADKFLSEIGWREFCCSLAFHSHDLATRNLNPRFDAFPWDSENEDAVQAWRRGQTGYPLIDAGMRQLRQTGAMHNRARMVAASFLCKHLLTDWRIGERWFWDNLCDADPASNPANWQWAAGCGADAAPYFRIFNPISQSEKFDPDGVYIKRFVAELADVPAPFIHAPWRAPAGILARAGVCIGETYPAPIIDHGAARARALAAYASLRETRSLNT